MPRRSRPRVQKVSESAFFEDHGPPAAGDTFAWRNLALPVALLVCLAVLSSLLYTGVYVSNPPALVVDAALRANEYVPHPGIALVRRGFGYYSVILLDPSEGGDYIPAAWFRVTGSGQVLSVEKKFGDPRKGNQITILLESVGVLACLAGLWAVRKEISGFFRPQLRRF